MVGRHQSGLRKSIAARLLRAALLRIERDLEPRITFQRNPRSGVRVVPDRFVGTGERRELSRDDARLRVGVAHQRQALVALDVWIVDAYIDRVRSVGHRSLTDEIDRHHARHLLRSDRPLIWRERGCSRRYPLNNRARAVADMCERHVARRNRVVHIPAVRDRELAWAGLLERCHGRTHVSALRQERDRRAAAAEGKCPADDALRAVIVAGQLEARAARLRVEANSHRVRAVGNAGEIGRDDIADRAGAVGPGRRIR